MQTVLRPVLLSLWLTAAFTPMPAAPAVHPGADRITANFEHPEKFTDLKDHASAMPAYEGALSDDDIVAVLSWIKSQWPADIRAKHDQINQQARGRAP